MVERDDHLYGVQAVAALASAALGNIFSLTAAAAALASCGRLQAVAPADRSQAAAEALLKGLNFKRTLRGSFFLLL